LETPVVATAVFESQQRATFSGASPTPYRVTIPSDTPLIELVVCHSGSSTKPMRRQHDEIASYGSARDWVTQLGPPKQATVLQ